MKTSSSGPTASSHTRSIRDLTKRGDRASGLRSTNGTPGLSSLGSSERPDRTMSPSCQQRQPDPEMVSAEPLWKAGAGSDSSGFLTPMAAASAQRSMTRDMPRGCGTNTNARTATPASRFPRRPCSGGRCRVRIVPAGPRGGRATALPSCITEESERSPRECRWDRNGCRRGTSTGQPGCTESPRQRPRSRRILRAWRSLSTASAS